MRRLLDWVLALFGRVLCDRCGQAVNGFIEEASTAGVYDVRRGYWKAVARAEDHEHFICDRCMWRSPGYEFTHGEVTVLVHGAPTIHQSV